jgi:hypothetical protein
MKIPGRVLVSGKMSEHSNAQQNTVQNTAAPVSFPIPGWGQRDPHFGLPRSFWIATAVPGKGRHSVPVKSFRLGTGGPGSGRRLIDYASARAHVESIRDAVIASGGAR